MPSTSFDARERATLVGVFVLFTLMAFQETSAGAVLPTAAKDLGGIGSFGWVYTGFVTAKIVGLVLAAQYSDTRGPRSPLIAGMLLFPLSSLAIGAAPTMSWVIVGRLLQGCGTGMLLTSVYVVIGRMFSAAKAPRVQSVIGYTFVVPSLMGPLVAGVIAQYTSWRWTFFGLIPLAVVAMLLMVPVLRALHRPAAPAMRRKNLAFALGVAAAIAVLEHVGQHPPAWPVLVGVATCSGLLLAWGLRGVLPSGTFQLRRGVAAPIGLRGILAGVVMGLESVIPLMLTVQHGYSPMLAGLPLAVGGTAWSVGSWLQSRPTRGDDEVYRIRLVRLGFGLTALATLVAAAVAFPTVSGWWALAASCLASVGAGLTMTTVNVLVQRRTTEEERGFNSAATQLAGAAGTAVLTGLGGVLVATAARGALSFDTTFLIMNLTMTVVLTIGMVFTGRLGVDAVAAHVPSTVGRSGRAMLRPATDEARS